MKPVFRNVGLALVLAGLGWHLYRDASLPDPAGSEQNAATQHSAEPADSVESTAAIGVEDAAQRAFAERAEGRMLLAAGRVQRILADDRDGSPHQRFIISTDAGQSLLVAHNLDLAPRLDGLDVGDEVAVLGLYEWNAQGGVMHWTHDDPAGNHDAGYIDWRGQRYQ
jgi:Protein of unknown function (DUF3465)